MYYTSLNIYSNYVRTTYYTRKSLTAVPIGNILHPENNVSDYTVTVDGYNDNIVYSKYYPTAPDGGYWQEKFVHNPEGLTRHYSYEEHYPFYFIKDHLGNIRETYIKPAPNEKYLIQRMQYYPSGIPWKTSWGAIEHPYRYNGKELVQMHGQNEYDSHARWYYPAICRTTTMDPHTERRYHLSPYAWCSNNFANHIDPNGKDDVFDTRGLFLQHVDNGTDYIMIKNSNGELRNITEFSYCEEDVTNRTMLANVGTYFAQQNGLDQTLDICDIDCEGAIAATDVESDFHQVYMIIINGSISPNANTSNNILNTIEHEKDHVEKGTRGSMAEVYAIIRGIANPTWSKTTDTYKQGIISYLIGFAIDAINHGQFDELKSALTPYLDIINQVIEMRFEDNKFMYGMLQYDITDIICTPASIK